MKERCVDTCRLDWRLFGAALGIGALSACTNPFGITGEIGITFQPGLPSPTPSTSPASGPGSLTGWSMSSPTNGTTSSDSSPIVTANGTEDGAVISLYTESSCLSAAIDSATVTGGTVTLSPTLSGDGAYSFYYQSVATGGSSACLSSTLSYTLDTTAPGTPSALALVTPASSPSSNTTPVIRVSGVASGLVVKLFTSSSCTAPSLRDTVTASATTADLTSSTLTPDGTFNFYATATDAAGNESACSTATLAYVLDTTAPVLASASISNSSPTNTTTYSLTYGTITGSYASYCILENSTTVGSCTWTAGSVPASFTVSGTNNAKVLSVWLKDSAGNISARVDTNSVTLDTTTPSLAWTPLTSAFGTAFVGTNSSSTTFTLTNSGTANATGCSAPTITNTTDFTIVTDGCGTSNVAMSGGTCTVDIRANPATTGAKTTTLSRVCTVGGTVSTTTNAITVTGLAYSAANSTIAGSGPVTADGTASSTITITLKDNNNDPVAGFTPTFTATDTGSTNVYGACSSSDASGISTCTLKSTKAETKTLSIATPVSKSDGTVVFSPGAPDATQTTLVATGPVSANTTSTSTITMTLKDANGNPIPSYSISSITSSGTRNTFPTPCGTTTNASGQIVCTLASAKGETKTITLEVVAATSFKTTTVTFDPFKRDLQVPLELCDMGPASLTSATFYQKCATQINTNAYDGDTVTYEFEVSAGNAHATIPYKVYLTNVDNTADIAEVTIPANTARTRQKVAFTPTAGTNIYSVRTSATAVANNVKVYLARVLVTQVQATKTRIYIPLTAADYVPVAGAGSQIQFTGTSGSWVNSEVFYSSWIKNPSAFTGITGNAFTFMGVGRKSAGAGTFNIGLYNKTNSTPITGGSVSFTTTVEAKTVSFASGATGFTDGSEMEARIYNSVAGTSGHLHRGGLFIALDNLAKLEVHHRVALQKSTGANFVNNYSKFLFAQTSNPSATAYFEATSTSDVDADCNYSLLEAAGEGAVGGTIVTGSTLTAGLTQATARSSSITLTDTKRYFLDIARTSSTTCIVINPRVVLSFDN